MVTSHMPADDAVEDRPISTGPVLIRSVDGLDLDAYAHSPAPAVPFSGGVVLVHGIGADLDEGGMYGRLGNSLADRGYGVVRFSFRGHGHSGGTARGATLAGEMLDIQAVVARTRDWFPGPLTVVASSFGAVPVLESAHLTRPDRLVLWNPILDLHRTFVAPELPWGRDNFDPDAWRSADTDGFLLLDGEFELGWVLLSEIRRYRPDLAFAALTAPTLIVHGDRDSYVSYDTARTAAAARSCDLHTVHGSDHGFDTREREDEAIDATAAWLAQTANTPAQP